jgi:hypothetical protein
MDSFYINKLKIMKLFAVVISAEYEFAGLGCSGGGETSLKALVFAKDAEKAKAVALKSVQASVSKGELKGYLKLTDKVSEVPMNKEYCLAIV